MPRTASGKPRVQEVRRRQKNGDVYVYEVTTVYNPEKRYNEHVSSRLVGKIESGGGGIVPTRPRRESRAPGATAGRVSAGATDILEWIGRESGIDADLLRSADEGTALKIISIARFWTANPDRTIRRIEEWQIGHRVPYADGITEDMCYRLMRDLGNDASVSQNYFMARAARSAPGSSVAVDTTTISSYSENLGDARYGYSKDGRGLATVKLLTLFGTGDRQPIAFQRQPGNIPDVISVLNAIRQLSVLGMKKPLVVLDGGFFSEDNILGFIRSRTKFLMRGRIDGKWISPELARACDGIQKPSNSCPWDPGVYGVTVLAPHDFTRERKRNWGDFMKGDTVTESHRLYLHFYLNPERARVDRESLMKDIQDVKAQIERGVDRSLMSKSELRIIDRFLRVKSKKRGGGVSVAMDDDSIMREAKYYGCFVLVSNAAMGTFDALREYRLRERTEEGFRLDKQYNDAYVTRSKTTPSLEGRFFCQFVAYGYEEYFRSALNRVKGDLAVPNGDPAHDNSESFKKEKALLGWLNRMSIPKLFDWFDAVQETTVNTKAGKVRWRTETTERDRLFLRKLGVIERE